MMSYQGKEQSYIKEQEDRWLHGNPQTRERKYTLDLLVGKTRERSRKDIIEEK